VTTTLPLAYDTITNYLLANWATEVAGICDAVPELRFADNEVGEIPKTYFVRFSMVPVTERQSTFRNGEDKRYTSTGVLYLQVFAPRLDERAAERRRDLAHVGKTLFRGKSLDGCIWFRNVRINWLQPDDKFLRANVAGDYEFDEIG
jgi:hypothetical protein